MKKFFQILFPTKSKEFIIQESIDRIKYYINFNKKENEILEKELKVLECRIREIKNQK